jgi:predicted RNA methylase
MTSTSAEDYARHWTTWFSKGNSEGEPPRAHEWHASIDPGSECGVLLAVYLVHCAHRARALDVGVGTSASPRALAALGFARVDIVDCCEDVITAASETYADEPRVHCHVGDCRDPAGST